MNTALPVTDKLIPYLKRLDKSRVYCNFGELNAEYQERLGELFGAPVVTCSSATSGLTAALMALALPKGSLVACPSWTFVATPAAIVMAGHVPYFSDCDKDGVMRNVPKNIAAAVIVSPCGAPVAHKEYKVPVIIDAAGGFDSFSTVCKPGKHPVVISTHATKAFGTGEGGFVACQDKGMLEKIRRITNFGFNTQRNADVVGFNGKLSEYHAAVGLADLDEWEDKRERYLRKTKIYGLNYAASLVAIRSGEGRRNVYGCHKYKAFKDFPKTLLPVTEELMKKMSFVKVEL